VFDFYRRNQKKTDTNIFRMFAVPHHNISQKFKRKLSSNFADGKKHKLECGPMPNVMAALPNIGDALCSTPQSLADAHNQSAVQ